MTVYEIKEPYLKRERIFADVTCNMCHNYRRCEWFDERKLKAAGSKDTDGIFACYWCYCNSARKVDAVFDFRTRDMPK
jgi:hypothetical protein